MTLSVLVPAILLAQIEIPSEFTQAPAVRLSGVARLKSKAATMKGALERPLWMSLAGKRVLGNRAHVVVQVADRQAVPAGIRLLEPLGDQMYLASIDLASTLGAAMLAGRPAMGGVNALITLEPEDRLDPVLVQTDPTLTRLPRWSADESAGQTVRAEMLISYYADVDGDLARQDLEQLGIAVLEDSRYFQHFEVRVTPAQLRELSKADWVQFLEPSPPPPQTKDNAISARLIGDDKLQADPFSLTGRDVNLGIFDGGSVAAHTEFGDRLTNVDRATTSFHATHVAGTMIAAGNDPKLKGMAPAAKLFSWTFQGVVATKMQRGIDEQKISIANNSWGEGYAESSGTCGRYGTYGIQERDFDRLVREKNLTITFAAGNDRDWTDCSILPRGGFYTIGRPSTAKNIITVGAVAAPYAVAGFSSAGPLRDNRIKPDIVAMGVDVVSTYLTNRSQSLSGTSMATPAISGTAALLVERFKARNDGKLPSAALVKAALLNTAKDLGNIGPDYIYGYGLADAVSAVKALDDKSYVLGQVTPGASKTHPIEVPANAPSLRVMLVYSDADAVLTAASMVTNHLELVLTSPDGATRKLPLRLDPASPAADAVEREGDRDTVKQVVVTNPPAGSWKAEVRGVDVVTDSQDYVVTWNLAESPAPPCTITLSPTTQVVTEKADFAVLTVTTGNHCPRWTAEDLPEWAKMTGPSTRQGTDLAKIAIAANEGDAPRTANIRVGDRTIKVLQTFRCRPQPITPGEPVQSSLTTRDCFFDKTVSAFSKLYTFEAKQGQLVNISLESNDIDTYLILLAPNGAIFELDDDGYDRFGTNSRLPAGSGNMLLPIAGQYTIIATTYDPDEVGAFTLKLNFADQPGFVPVDPLRISGCPASVTGALTDESSRMGRRGDLYPTEVFQFPGRIGQEVTIEVGSPTVDAFVYLIGPGGDLVATGTDTDGSGKARITTILRDAGAFTIEVSAFSPFSRGEFVLQVEGCTRP
jgi:subtilisin family serine protease